MPEPPAGRASDIRSSQQPVPRLWRPQRPAVGARFRRLVAGVGPLYRRWRKGEDFPRLCLAFALAVLGLVLAGAAALSDVYLHRGIETGAAAPVPHSTGRELATNVDLTLFAPSDLDRVAASLQAAGFRYVRQPFAWSEIEPARGEFVWDRYDAIVTALADHGLQPVAVLHRSPNWARAEAQRGAIDAPPVDRNAYAAFAGKVVDRYRERLPFIQIWDAPNRPDRWGGASSDPDGYTDLLALASNAVRATRLATKVILAELDPTGGLEGEPGSDLVFLRGVYASGGAPFFDVAAARIDGGGRSPFDRWVAPGRLNLSRAVLFRELLVEMGDGQKPVWATRYGWRAGGTPGDVSAQEQAEFVTAGLARARAEWPWMELLFASDFVAREGEETGYALVGGDGVPTPMLGALTTFARGGGADVAPTGFVPVEARQVAYEGDWALQHLNEQTYRITSEVGARVTVRFAGTGLSAVLRRSREAGPVEATIDGRPFDVDLQWYEAVDTSWVLADGLEDGPHRLTLTLVGDGQLTIGGLIVRRSVPGMWPIVLLATAGLVSLFVALRQLAYTAAQRSGHLQRRRGVDLWPELPQLPDWRPARRT